MTASEHRVRGPATGVVNEVRICGRLARDPEERVLPSGDVMWTFSVVVPRGTTTLRTRQTVDVLDCAAWSGRARRSVAGWRAGDVVEVGGSVRRRFYRSSGSPVSRVEVEMVSGRRVRRAAPA